MSSRMGKVRYGDGRWWQFSGKYDRTCLSGKFPEDFYGDKLKCWSLDLCNIAKGDIRLFLERYPMGEQFDLVIDWKIFDEKKEVQMIQRWQVTNLSGIHSRVHLYSTSTVDKILSGWTTWVAIRSIKGTLCCGKTPISFRIPTVPLVANTRAQDPPGIPSTSLSTNTTVDQQIVHKSCGGTIAASSTLNTSSSKGFLRRNVAKAQSKLLAKTVKLIQLRMNCGLSTSKFKTEVTLVTNLQSQLRAKSVTIDKLTRELKVKSESIDILQTDLAYKEDQLQKIITLCEKDSNLIDGQSSLEQKSPNVSFNHEDFTDDVQSASILNRLDSQCDSASEQMSFGGINDDRCEPNSHECSEPPAKRRKISQSGTDVVDIDAETVAPVEVEIPSLPDVKVKEEIIVIEELPVYPGWEADSFADFEIRTADNYSFPVSKSILARNSDVFKALLSPDTLESQQGHTTTEYDADVILPLLKFIYPGNFDSDLSVVAMELFKAAHYYNIDGLKDLCMKEIVKQISLENLLVMIELADQFNSVPMMQKSVEFIRQRAKDELIWKALLPLVASIPDVHTQISTLAHSKGKLNLQNFRFSN